MGLFGPGPFRFGLKELWSGVTKDLPDSEIEARFTQAAPPVVRAAGARTTAPYGRDRGGRRAIGRPLGDRAGRFRRSTGLSSSIGPAGPARPAQLT